MQNFDFVQENRLIYDKIKERKFEHSDKNNPFAMSNNEMGSGGLLPYANMKNNILTKTEETNYPCYGNVFPPSGSNIKPSSNTNLAAGVSSGGNNNNNPGTTLNNSGATIQEPSSNINSSNNGVAQLLQAQPNSANASQPGPDYVMSNNNNNPI